MACAVGPGGGGGVEAVKREKCRCALFVLWMNSVLR